MVDVEFTTRLPKEKYLPKAGWACPALSIPSAEIARLALGDRVLGAEDFLALAGHVRLAEGIEVADAEVTIRVTRRLTTARSSVFVAVAATLVALGAVASAYRARPPAGCVEARETGAR